MMMNLYYAISLYLITCLTSVNANTTIFTGSLYILVLGVVQHLLTGLVYISVGGDYAKNIILSVIYFDC